MRIIVLQRNAIYFLFFFSLLLRTAERNLFLILLLLTSSSYNVSTDYYTRPIKSKWLGLVANLRPLRITSAANNYNKY